MPRRCSKLESNHLLIQSSLWSLSQFSKIELGWPKHVEKIGFILWQYHVYTLSSSGTNGKLLDRSGPYFIFVDYFEAFIYGGQKVTTSFFNQAEDKLNHMVQLLKTSTHEKRVVLCSNADAGVATHAVFLCTPHNKHFPP